MKVHLKIEEHYKEIEVHIYANEYSTEVEQIMKALKTPQADVIDGYKENEIRMLKIEDIFTVYVEDTKVYFQTEEDEFESKRKLYEIEAILENKFARVNKSMLVNISKIESIQLGIIATPEIVLENGATVHISRKYFKLLKNKLRIGRDS